MQIHILIINLLFPLVFGFVRTFRPTSFSSRFSITNEISTEEVTQNAKLQRSDTYLVDLNILDFPSILLMCNNQFLSSNSTMEDRVELNNRICSIFLPKFVDKLKKGHEVIGMKTRQGTLIGFVDLSLQSKDGSLDVLNPSTFDERVARYTRANLQPYLCNLLVSPEYRKQGIAQRLVQECETRASKLCANNFLINRPMPAQYLHLHVELNETPALKLYLKCGFTECRRIPTETGDVLFMRKPIKPVDIRAIKKV